MIDDAYTRPEKFCAKSQARSVGQRVREDGGCCYCTRRSRLFDNGRIATCGLTPPAKFPQCLDRRTGFEFDEAAFRGQE